MGNGSGRLEDRYYLQKVKLGQGSFGTVWRAVDRQTNDVVAIKQLDKAAMPRRGVKRQDIEREIKVMQVLEHENVTRLLGFFEDPNSIYLALEYCDGGDFGDKVKERGLNLKEDEAAEWMRMIMSAIAALHAKSICHRDIKPDNFMVHQGIVKLSDFGLALFLESNRLLTEKCGTPAFMAPEQHKLPRLSRGYTNACDIWAAGVTMYMLMFGGKHPFLGYGNQLDEKRLIEGKLDFSANQGFLGFAALSDGRYSEPARQLCRQLVEPDVSQRISAETACQDAWLVVRSSNKQPQGLMRNISAPLGDAPTPSPVRGLASDTPTPLRADRRAKTCTSGGLAPATRIASDDSCGTPVPSWWPFGGLENSPPNVSPSPSPDHNGDNKAELNKDIDEKAKRIEALEAQLKLQQEQNESQWEALVHSNKVMEQLKEERKQLAEWQQRKAPPPLPGFYDARRGSKDGRRASKPSSATPTPDLSAQKADQAPSFFNHSRKGSKGSACGSEVGGFPQGYDPNAKTILPVGTKCKYQSPSWSGYIPAVVQGYNESDGTYNLDCRPHAKPEKICPAGDVSAAEAWAPGTLVLYQSNSVRAWLPAVIKSYNEGVGDSQSSYNLDVREHAPVDRMRPRFPIPTSA